MSDDQVYSDETEVSTETAVEISKAVDSVYSVMFPK